MNVQTTRKYWPAVFCQLLKFDSQRAALLLQLPDQGVLGAQQTIQLSNCNRSGEGCYCEVKPSRVILCTLSSHHRSWLHWKRFNQYLARHFYTYTPKFRHRQTQKPADCHPPPLLSNNKAIWEQLLLEYSLIAQMTVESLIISKRCLVSTSTTTKSICVILSYRQYDCKYSLDFP